MADEADVANDHIEMELAMRISAARRIVAVPQSTTCLNCEDPVSGGKRYCSKDCQEDDELRARKRRLSGDA
jgi:hypothetical protein